MKRNGHIVVRKPENLNRARSEEMNSKVIDLLCPVSKSSCGAECPDKPQLIYRA